MKMGYPPTTLSVKIEALAPERIPNELRDYLGKGSYWMEPTTKRRRTSSCWSAPTTSEALTAPIITSTRYDSDSKSLFDGTSDSSDSSVSSGGSSSSSSTSDTSSESRYASRTDQKTKKTLRKRSRSKTSHEGGVVKMIGKPGVRSTWSWIDVGVKPGARSAWSWIDAGNKKRIQSSPNCYDKQSSKNDQKTSGTKAKKIHSPKNANNNNCSSADLSNKTIERHTLSTKQTQNFESLYGNRAPSNNKKDNKPSNDIASKSTISNSTILHKKFESSTGTSSAANTASQETGATADAKPRCNYEQNIEFRAVEGPNQPIARYALDLIALVCNNSYCSKSSGSNHSCHSYQQAHRVLDTPASGRTTDTESEKERLMRLQFRHRFASATSTGMSPIEFSKKLLKLWGGRLVEVPVNIHGYRDESS